MKPSINDLPIGSEKWLEQMLSAKAVREGGVIRRKTKHVHKVVGRDDFISVIRMLGFRLLETCE